jgi:hypothetical protein
MPVPRKIDLIPAELRDWLREALVARGFSGYEQLAEDLNFRLEEAGSEIRIQRSALQDFGQGWKEFVKVNEMASRWSKEWLATEGFEAHADRHDVLFQMLANVAFKQLQGEIQKEDTDIDPKNLHFMGRMLKDLMSSSALSQAIREKEHKAQAAAIDAAVERGEVGEDFRAEARRILGFA